MKTLRRDGFVFDAVRNRGYRIRATPERLSLPYLQCLLPGPATEDRLVFFNRTESTNRDAERLLGEGRNTPFIVLSRRQTKGRGRLGRAWHSSDEGNLYASFAFRPKVPPERMQRFTLWTGVSICRCIEEETGLSPRIKWPNDILCGTLKIGGILTEARVNADQILEMVLGIGLNINSAPSLWASPLCTEATSLREALQGKQDINRLTCAIITSLFDAYDAFMNDGYRTALNSLWEKYDLLRGRNVTAQQGKETISGRALGIDEEGRLLIATKEAAANPVRLNAGDVTLNRSRELSPSDRETI